VWFFSRKIYVRIFFLTKYRKHSRLDSRSASLEHLSVIWDMCVEIIVLPDALHFKIKQFLFLIRNISWVCLPSVLNADMTLSYPWFELVICSASEIFLKFYRLVGLGFFFFQNRIRRECCMILPVSFQNFFWDNGFNKRGQKLMMAVLSMPP